MRKKLKLSLNITWMYPDLMNTYGDRGNIIVLEKRCLWRGIEAKILMHTIDSPVSDLENSNLIFMGGAQDRQQKLVSSDLYGRKGKILKNLINKGIPGLFICGAYQFLGHYYKPAQGEEISGLSIFDLKTIHYGDDKPRAIGNLAVEWENIALVGFENHGGRTYLGPLVKPFAKVLKGYGNNGEDKTEGAIYKNAVGSYLHGPLLSKNPEFADWLISKALGIKYGKFEFLIKLNDTLEIQARNAMLAKIKICLKTK